MANYNAGIRFNDVMAKYMFLEFDSHTGTCTVHIEGDKHGATIYPTMWKTEDDPGED